MIRSEDGLCSVFSSFPLAGSLFFALVLDERVPAWTGDRVDAGKHDNTSSHLHDVVLEIISGFPSYKYRLVLRYFRANFAAEIFIPSSHYTHFLDSLGEILIPCNKFHGVWYIHSPILHPNGSPNRSKFTHSTTSRTFADRVFMTRHAAGFLTFGAASSFGRFSILGLLIQRYQEPFTNSRVDSPTQVLHLEWLQPTKPPLNTTNMFFHHRIHWLKHLHSHHFVCVWIFWMFICGQLVPLFI